jgi:hypothetical protein
LPLKGWLDSYLADEELVGVKSSLDFEALGG